MKRSNERSLGDALGDMVDALGLREKLDEQALVAAWANITGPMIVRHTKAIRLKAGILYIKVDSAPLRQELGYQRDGLIQLLNERLGRVVVTAVQVE
jgi:predicted nucleic acid-binding Zn ribbon protein